MSVQSNRMVEVASKVRTNKKLLFGLVVLTPIVLSSLFAPYVVPHDPLETDVINRYDGLGGEYPLGSDHLGRDILSRTIMGGQISLFIGFISVALSLVMGVPIGMIAGYKGGKIDEGLMRLMDMVMSIPTLLLGILVLTLLPNNMWSVMLVVGVVYSPKIARVVRSATLNVVNQEFIMAAKARNESDSYILLREILPNIKSPIIVEGTVRFGFAILVATSLSFLGLGAQPPNPDWGYMVSVSRNHIYHTPWFLLWPCVFLFLTILSTNVLGDGLRDLFDVKEDGESV